MKKALRQAVYAKFGGHCAYCGQEIEFKKMQVDHFWPKFLSHFHPEVDKDAFENLMPSCQKCNLHKSGMRPEMWREQLRKQVIRLRENAQFDRALRFGQVRITPCPIVFHFEKQGA